ncbi:uncharacterized protein [Haliotis asinina]|uniref:uncharacterized protein n=1 Tax=Haliotis asinina TaxID=109174 RepID=UPI0035325CC1
MTTRRPGELFRTTPDTGWKENDLSGFILTGGRSLESVLDAIKSGGTGGGGEEKIQQDDTRENAAKDDVEKVVEAEMEEDKEQGLNTREVLDKALAQLESLNLVEAERLFLKAYQRLEDTPEENYRSKIEIFIGLAETCTRRSRTSRQSPLEWQWLCVHATTLLQETIEMCITEIDLEQDNQWMDWYQSKRDWAINRVRGLEDVLARTIHNWLRENWRVVDPYHTQNVMGSLTPTTSTKFPLSSLLGLGIKPYQSGFLTQSFSLESLHEAPLSEAMSIGNANWFKRLQLYCKRRLYNKNVQEILDEVLHFRGSLLDFDRSSSQRLSLDTLTDGSDAEYSDHVDVDTEAKVDTAVKEHSLSYELAASDVDKNGWDFFLEERKNCEISGILQLATEPSEDNDVLGATSQEAILPEPIVKKDFVSPLQEQPIKLVIAKVFHKVVAKLLHEDEYQKAEMLCEEILQIVDDIQDGTVRLLRFSAQLLQNIGILCLRQGDASKGMVHLERALQIFRDLQERDAHREVALVLIDLGNAHVAKVLHEDALHKHIIAAMSEFFEKEASDESDSADSSPESKKSDETVSAEDMNSINEAITCYTEALMVLENNDESNIEYLAKALRKLGDCHFVVKNYNDSLDSYERSMGYLRSSSAHGKDTVLQNAHVLCMLGVSTFMLHVYPRAASVFELAYRMIRQAQYSYRVESETFFQGLLHSLLGICYYKMKSYHKCVSMCYQAFEVFWNMYGEKIPELKKEKFWLICQNLYILGNSYNVLNLQHKAIKYLNIGRALMQESKNGEKRQCMRILQILGDCYFAQYDYKTALTYYNEALDFGNHENMQLSEPETTDEMTTSSDDMALHNQLLSRSADAHISMNQYQNAVHYLEQARDIQDVLGEDIKGDLVSTLYQLGQMHSFAGDVDKAIDSYKESIEISKELHGGEVGPELCSMLGNLATMCYVKACICESIEQELELILKAEQYFQDAIAINMNQSVCVKYANFLYSQGNYEDAIMYLEDALKAQRKSDDIVFGGLEKVTLPEPLQDEVDAQEEVVMPSRCLGKYILVLSHVMLRQPKLAEKWIIQLMKDVYDSDIPFMWSVLGYALMELGLFEEAAISFGTAATLDPEYNLAIDNHCLCLCIMTLVAIERVISTIFIHEKIWYEDQSLPELSEGTGY